MEPLLTFRRRLTSSTSSLTTTTTTTTTTKLMFQFWYPTTIRRVKRCFSKMTPPPLPIPIPLHNIPTFLPFHFRFQCVYYFSVYLFSSVSSFSEGVLWGGRATSTKTRLLLFLNLISTFYHFQPFLLKLREPLSSLPTTDKFDTFQSLHLLTQ